MEVKNIPLSTAYLQSLPLNEIAKYSKSPQDNALPFIGYPKQHPTEKNKIILIYEPLGDTPAVLEFKLDDVLFAQEVSQAVTEKGEGIPQIKLWIRRGAHGMILEPFEVGENGKNPLSFIDVRREIKERFTSKQA
ncbi:MAG: hypothetical protein FWD91_01130 [Treponema sp.]|nr:hypothetical protein [Treponema sp.]